MKNWEMISAFAAFIGSFVTFILRRPHWHTPGGWMKVRDVISIISPICIFTSSRGRSLRTATKANFVRLARKSGPLLILCAIFIAPGAQAAEAGVTVYQHCNYGGNAIPLPPGKYSMQDLLARGVLNDDVSSIRVPEGYTVTIYEHDFQGRSRTLSQSDECLVNSGFNDVTSSISVSRSPDGAGLQDGYYTIQQKSTKRFLRSAPAQSWITNWEVKTKRPNNYWDQVFYLHNLDKTAHLYSIQAVWFLWRDNEHYGVTDGWYLDAYEDKKHNWQVRTSQKESDGSQEWMVKLNADGTAYTIQQNSSGRYLDAYGGDAFLRSYKVVTRTEQLDDSQYWILRNVDTAVNNYNNCRRNENLLYGTHCPDLKIH